MKYHHLDVDSSLRELSSYENEDFPVRAYIRDMSKTEEGPLVLHWHDDLQFVIPLTGPILFTVCDKPYVLNPNEYLFINSQRLHMAKPLHNTGGEFICIDFHPRLLYGYSNSLISRLYVQPFLASYNLQALLLDGSAPWHARAKALIDELARLYSARDYAYELLFQKIIIEIWLLIIPNYQDIATADAALSYSEQERLNCILEFIKNRYMEKITLPDIAAAVNLSDSECCRFVKRTLGMSPMVYLNHFRVVKSANLLQTSNLSITEIAQAMGFGSSSYYTERFKRVMNCKPLEYRRKFTVACPKG